METIKIGSDKYQPSTIEFLNALGKNDISSPKTWMVLFQKWPTNSICGFIGSARTSAGRPRGQSKRPLSGRATAVPIREVATGTGSWVEDDEKRDVLLLQAKMDDIPQTYSRISK